MPRGASVPLPLWTSVRFSAPVAGAGAPADITRELEGVVRRMAEEVQGSESALAAPPAQEKPPAPPLRVAVIGIDGSGKSTCSRELVARLAGEMVVTGLGDTLLLGRGGSVEETDWVPGALLKQCLHRLAKGADRLTGYKLAKLAELVTRCGIQEVMTLKFRPAVAAADGHPLINILAWGILAYPERFSPELCRETLDLLTGRGDLPARRLFFFARTMPEVLALRWWAGLQPPDLVLFLAVPPDAAIRRIVQRGEKRQLHETPEQLARLQEAYATVTGLLRAEYGVEVHRIEAGERAVPDIMAEALRLVRGRLEAHGSRN
jgi:adenylate kinase family enzyme